VAESRVCFVVTELLGLVRNGGIATATTHAALVLAKEGYDVELFYCGFQEQMEPEWITRYRDGGIEVRWLDRTQMAHPPFLADSFRLYHQLKHLTYDVIVFQDWQGLGYCSMAAKKQGLAFDATRLIHICHGPDEWLREANRQLDFDGMQLGSAHLERRSAEYADAIVGPSRHLIDWMEAAGWPLAAERHVIPYFTEGHTVDLSPAPARVDRGERRLTELVLFGRLEERKGVRVFADALNLLGSNAVDGMAVTFLGREATLTPTDVTTMIDKSVRDRLADLRFIGNYDQAAARDYLQQPGRLALIPSYLDNSPNVVYECIEDGISFLASRAGGTGELVADADKDATLFDPNPRSLADKLRPLLESRRMPPPPGAAYDGVTSLAAWRPLLAPPPPTPFELTDPPLVSVVVPHHNQPELIWPTLASIVEQDYPNLEIVLVDDGSTDEAAIANLRRLEAHEWGRPFKLVRQENLYLGAARNTGVRNASGDVLAFVDDDDVVEPTYVRSLLTAMVRTGADAVSMAIHVIEADEHDAMLADAPNSVWVFLGDAVHLGTMINVLGGAAAMYRRSALDAVGGFFTHTGIGHEDWDLLARLNLSGHRVVSVPEHLYKYRVRPTSMLRTTPTWANMQPVFASYEAHLPDSLKVWAELTRGQQDVINSLRESVGPLVAENQALREQLAIHERYVSVLRRALPPKARASLRSFLSR